jgi:RecJ-like exonuclease
MRDQRLRPVATDRKPIHRNEAHMQQNDQTLNPGDEGSPDAPGVGEDTCTVCSGTGQVEGHRCGLCNGTGKILQGIGGG